MAMLVYRSVNHTKMSMFFSNAQIWGMAPPLHPPGLQQHPVDPSPRRPDDPDSWLIRWLNQPIWKILLVKLDHFPKVQGENSKNIWNHHLGNNKNRRNEQIMRHETGSFSWHAVKQITKQSILKSPAKLKKDPDISDKTMLPRLQEGSCAMLAIGIFVCFGFYQEAQHVHLEQV